MKALLVISEDGYAKRVPLAEFPRQKNRGAQGVKLSSVPIAAALVVDGVDGDLVIATASGKIERVAVRSIPTHRRINKNGGHSKGVRVIRLAEGDRVATACLPPPDVPPIGVQTPPDGLGGRDWPWGATGLREGERIAAFCVLRPPRPLATITPGGKPAVPRSEWAETAVHKASSYSCAHCGVQYEHPDQVYACIDDHAAEVAPRALAA